MDAAASDVRSGPGRPDDPSVEHDVEADHDAAELLLERIVLDVFAQTEVESGIDDEVAEQAQIGTYRQTVADGIEAVEIRRTTAPVILDLRTQQEVGERADEYAGLDRIGISQAQLDEQGDTDAGELRRHIRIDGRSTYVHLRVHDFTRVQDFGLEADGCETTAVEQGNQTGLPCESARQRRLGSVLMTENADTRAQPAPEPRLPLFLCQQIDRSDQYQHGDEKTMLCSDRHDDPSLM